MPRLSLTVVMPGQAFEVDLPQGRAVLVGRGAPAVVVVPLDGVAGRHLSLTARETIVEVEQLGDGATLNDVPLSGPASARPGDELGLFGARLIIGAHEETLVARRMSGHDELLARLEDETSRARSAGRGRTVGLVMVGLSPLNIAARQAMQRRLQDESARAQPATCWGELSADVWAAVIPELLSEELTAHVGQLEKAAGPRATVVSARWPGDGPRGEHLLERAFERLFPPAPYGEELVVVDPVMVRLKAAAEEVAEVGAKVAAVGEEGSGRASLLRALAETKGVELTETELAFNDDAPKLPAKGAWLLRHADALAPAELAALVARAQKNGLWVMATGEKLDAAVFPLRLAVPPLNDRRADVLPLAESFLGAFRARLARPRLSLGAEARALLLRYRWPGNVRELRNVVARAARAALRDEVGRDALFDKLSSEAPADSFRGALKTAERDLLLEALARTRWNVTKAAARLGMPRRTVVYRMGKLGLKRPAR